VHRRGSLRRGWQPVPLHTQIENSIESLIKGVGSFTSTAGDLTLTGPDSAAIVANAIGGSIAGGGKRYFNRGALSIGVFHRAQHDSTRLWPTWTIRTCRVRQRDRAERRGCFAYRNLMIPSMPVHRGEHRGSGVPRRAWRSARRVGIHKHSSSPNQRLYPGCGSGDHRGFWPLEARNTSDITAKVITGFAFRGAGGTTGVALP